MTGALARPRERHERQQVPGAATRRQEDPHAGHGSSGRVVVRYGWLAGGGTAVPAPRGTVPGVFDHVTIRVADRAAAERFYATVLATLGVEQTYRTRVFTEWRDFSLAQADAEHPVTTGLHVGFVAPSTEQVRAFWQAGVDAGYRDDGAPGPRPQYREDYVGGFLLDPDGNSAEAAIHGGRRRGGVVDHVWIRVADVAASVEFYSLVGAHAGFTAREVTDDYALMASGNGSFSLVSGPPTRNLHMAFGVHDDDRVGAFHAAAVAAGHRDQGVPGERPQYHPGYYAAYVLDPDGNNIELVNHRRE
jgi:catechol 2,3-dioxygenase-like lactoylglutathione lyase family enzyme